jgi:hypothetical protein
MSISCGCSTTAAGTPPSDVPFSTTIGVSASVHEQSLMLNHYNPKMLAIEDNDHSS